MSEENRRVLEFYKTKVTLHSAIHEYVEELYANKTPMAVASATERTMIEAALEHTGILDRFKGVLSCSDVGKGKDQPDVFLKACELINTSPAETLVVDDSPTAIETAKKAGFQTWLIE